MPQVTKLLKGRVRAQQNVPPRVRLGVMGVVMPMVVVVVSFRHSGGITIQVARPSVSAVRATGSTPYRAAALADVRSRWTLDAPLPSSTTDPKRR